MDMHSLFLSIFGLKVLFRAKKIDQKDSLLEQLRTEKKPQTQRIMLNNDV